VQPAVIGPNDILITTAVSTGGVGTRRLAVTHGPNGWKAEGTLDLERAEAVLQRLRRAQRPVRSASTAPFFRASILADGKRKWKGGRYGNGQLVLLADQDVLLVMSEEGELALVAAATDEFRELARFKALDAQDLESPGRDPRHAADSQRRRDGRLPAAARRRLIGDLQSLARNRRRVKPMRVPPSGTSLRRWHRRRGGAGAARTISCSPPLA
jgi:hypothetical protein